MIRLIYRSQSRAEMTHDEIDDILKIARRRNALDDISGLLIYHQGRFLQVLEGPEEAVRACFDRVRRDPRHSAISVLHDGPAQTRAFSKWFMGYARPEELPLSVRRSVLSIETIQQRLDSVKDQDVPENKKKVVQQLATFLMRFRDLNDVCDGRVA